MKIGLIAMSGIRVADQELADFGLTLPGFLNRGKAVASLPSLALLTLAGMTEKEHQLSYIEVPDLNDVETVPGDFDMVAISSYSAQINQAYELADRYRLQGTKVVIGGPHVSCLPLEAAQHCDAVAIGEGESIWRQIVDDCQRGQLRQFYGATFGAFDMRDAPMPAFELLDPGKYNRLTVQTSRGCPHRCEFCASSILITNKYKQKPVEKVLAEIDAIKSIWRRPFIEFVDDNAFVNRAYWIQLLPQLKKRQIKWFAETDISLANDDLLLGLMQESGCAQVLIGLESPVLSGMDHLELQNNWKFKVWNRYKKAIRMIQSRGIRVIGCFILGLDGHDSSVFHNLYEFVNELELFDVQITVQTPFPGTPLYARLQEEGRLLQENYWDACTLFDVNFTPSDMSVDELKQGFRSLAEQLYSQELTDLRQESFKEQMRQGKRQRLMAKAV